MASTRRLQHLKLPLVLGDFALEFLGLRDERGVCFDQGGIVAAFAFDMAIGEPFQAHAVVDLLAQLLNLPIALLCQIIVLVLKLLDVQRGGFDLPLEFGDALLQVVVFRC